VKERSESYSKVDGSPQKSRTWLVCRASPPEALMQFELLRHQNQASFDIRHGCKGDEILQ
jgi:hypothetical protein